MNVGKRITIYAVEGEYGHKLRITFPNRLLTDVSATCTLTLADATEVALDTVVTEDDGDGSGYIEATFADGDTVEGRHAIDIELDTGSGVEVFPSRYSIEYIVRARANL